MTDPRAAAIIDELLLMMWNEFRLDEEMTTKALTYLFETRCEHPHHPITLRFIIEMNKRGLVT